MKRYEKYGWKVCWIVYDMHIMEERQVELSEKIWKIEKKIVKWYWKYGRKVSWIVKRYGRKVSWIVKRYGKCRRKVGWIVKWYGRM